MKSSGLYVHVPFCERKCGYCSFFSMAGQTERVPSWLDALKREAARYGGNGKIPLRTLYIGGGTPTVLDIPQWEQLMTTIREYFDTSTIIEATCEANPNSLTPSHISFLKDNGFTRISLGVQSLIDSELETLGRLHDSVQALRAMERVKSSGLELGCDLIFAIPGQTLRTWDYSMRHVMEYASHISCYQLTLEPDAPMYSRYGGDDLNGAGYAFYRYAQYILPRHDFAQYEVSNFAPPGHECRHNISYWNHSDVIALGPSAVSYIDGVRYANPPSLDEYISGIEPSTEELSPHERAIELAILSLRTKWGISRAGLLPEIERAISDMPPDLFVITPERIALSKRGMRLGNYIWSEILFYAEH
ncbi:MAG: radical SAM family heme chaperone HemW [Synergistaceae bacterium]|nr:radical SAM family heme chaperone HemW [Synergistaceae bacterium]